MVSIVFLREIFSRNIIVDQAAVLTSVDYTVMGEMAMEASVVGILLVIMSSKVIVHGFHLHDKISTICEHIRWEEKTVVALESPTVLVPTCLVELVEVISPVEHELIGALIVSVHFNIVKEKVPWHIDRVQILAPH